MRRSRTVLARVEPAHGNARLSRRGFLGASILFSTAGLIGCARRRTSLPAASVAPASLEFWLPGRSGDEVALEPFHSNFVTETPSVSAIRTHLISKRGVLPKLATAIAADAVPDVVRLKDHQVIDLAALKDLLPLGRRVDLDPAINLRDFTPQSVRGSHFNHELVGLPDSHQLIALFWNKNLLDRAGLNPEKPPMTWDSLGMAAKRVRALKVSESSTPPWGFQFYEMSTREQAYAWFIEWVWRAGGNVWEETVG